MEKKQRGRDIQILVVPFPLQGHINPMLQLSKRLVSKGLKVTLIIPKSSCISMHEQSSSINVEAISDGFDAGVSAENLENFEERFKVAFRQSLAELVEKNKSFGYPVKLVIYDSVMPWILDVARGYGLDGAPFFTQSWAVNAIFYHFYHGTLQVPSEGSTVSLPSLPLLGKNDLPSPIYESASYHSLRGTLVNQISNISEPKWILCNTFDELEEEVMKWMASHCKVKSVGPTIPSIYLDKRLENDKDYGLSLFKPIRDASMTWLDSKEIDSVVYVSFGSMATLGEEQMEELAWGLKRSNCYFLWVVRESEKEKLPGNFSEEIISEKGLIVSWSPQLEVLAHKSVGCFMTHCGWNSTLESLSLGVPMVAMPQWIDQTTNAKFVADVWKVGIRVTIDEKGIVTREEIEKCIVEVMEGERAKDIRRNSRRWKELTKEAVDDGGSSDKNLEEIIAELVGS